MTLKKIAAFSLLSFLWFEISFSKETKLTCEYVETYYRNWDAGQFGETIKDDTNPKIIYFNITNGKNNKYGFKTDMPMANLDLVKSEKFVSKVDDDNYTFVISKNTNYISINLNRYNGRLTYTAGNTNDDSKYLMQYFYNCEKAKQKF